MAWRRAGREPGSPRRRLLEVLGWGRPTVDGEQGMKPKKYFTSTVQTGYSGSVKGKQKRRAVRVLIWESGPQCILIKCPELIN